MPDLDAQVDYIEDDVLRLIFLSCHPSLTAESRAALTLRLVGGLTTAEIARGFLATESTMGQRISRAKKTLSEAHAEFELPTGPERTRRLDDVMAVIYLIFNEGYTATAGEDWMRPDLANEAMRLARMLAALAPDEPEVLGLQALLEIQGSRMRRPARRARRAGAAGGAGPDALGPAADPARAGRPAAGRAARRAREAGREVLPAGLDRRPARPRRACRGHGLAPDRGAVRRPGRGRAGTGRRGEPGGRARAGVRPGRGARRAGRSWTPARSATRRSCRACAETCSSGPGCTRRQARRSPRRPRAPGTRASAPSCTVGPSTTWRGRRPRGERADASDAHRSAASPSPDPGVCAAGRTSRHEPTCRRTARSAGLASPAAWRHRDGAARQSGSGW